jgi:hypothetical protein
MKHAKQHKLLRIATAHFDISVLQLKGISRKDDYACIGVSLLFGRRYITALLLNACRHVAYVSKVVAEG